MSVYTFRDGILRAAPRWLRGTWGARVLYAVGLHLDVLADCALDAVRVRFPGESPETLPIIGRERGIRRGLDEGDLSYAERQITWLDDHRRKGDPYAILQQLAGYLAPHAVRLRIVNNAGAWFTRNAGGTFERHQSSPANWDWDGDAAAWSRFWVIIYATGIWARTTWGAPRKWGVGTWGSSATADEVASLRAIVADWKAAHSSCAWIVLAFDAASFDPEGAPGAPLPDGTWGHWSKNDGGVQVRSRIDTALYLDGEA